MGAAAVHHDLVGALLGVHDHRPVGLLAPEFVAGHQQPAVGQPVDGIAHRVAAGVPGGHDLSLAVQVDGHDLALDPVAEPQPAFVPPG